MVVHSDTLWKTLKSILMESSKGVPTIILDSCAPHEDDDPKAFLSFFETVCTAAIPSLSLRNVTLTEQNAVHLAEWMKKGISLELSYPLLRMPDAEFVILKSNHLKHLRLDHLHSLKREHERGFSLNNLLMDCPALEDLAISWCALHEDGYTDLCARLRTSKTL